MTALEALLKLSAELRDGWKLVGSDEHERFLDHAANKNDVKDEIIRTGVHALEKNLCSSSHISRVYTGTLNRRDMLSVAKEALARIEELAAKEDK